MMVIDIVLLLVGVQVYQEQLLAHLLNIAITKIDHGLGY